MIEYQKILNRNMLNVFKDILINIRDNGLSDNNQLYIIPEPLAISLIATSGLTLLIIKRKFL